jgi:hypothetical protein
VGWSDLHPPSLHPSAVLCIRRARIPAAIGPVHDLGARRRFGRALDTTLDDLARRAMRPAQGFDGWCDAVVFADLSELLACLARDWAAGCAADRWWWNVLLHGRVTIDAVVSRFERSAPHIAPAIERLAGWQHAPGFVSTLEPRHVHALTAAVMRAHGVSPAAQLLADPVAPPPFTAVIPLAASLDAPWIADEVRRLAISYGAAVASAPLRRDQRALLAIAAVARHHTALIRRPRFVEAFGTALGAIEARADVQAHPAAEKPAGRSAPVEPHGEIAATTSIPEPASGPPPFDAPGQRSRGDDAERVHGGTPAASRDDVGAQPVSDSPPDATSPRARDTAPALVPIAAAVDTPLGGVFYLLNVAIALRLYGDFTMPQRHGLPLSPWDCIALVAEHWLGEPLHGATAHLLAHLARRAPDERPGAGAISDDRLARWLPRIVRRVKRHVAAALGESAETNLSRRLLCHQAIVHVTAAHVDVTFDLALLPLEIRLGGLDRDPGWIPSAGRIVRFHYT